MTNFNLTQNKFDPSQIDLDVNFLRLSIKNPPKKSTQRVLGASLILTPKWKDHKMRLDLVFRPYLKTERKLVSINVNWILKKSHFYTWTVYEDQLAVFELF